MLKVIDGKAHIHQYEKHYLTLALRNLIGSEEKFLSECLADKDWVNQRQSQAMLPVMRRYINDLKDVAKRLESLPIC